jgi:hypothetical protein
MSLKQQKYYIMILVVGILLLSTYFLRDFLWDTIWVFFVIPLGIFAMCFLALFILVITAKNRRGIITGIAVIGIIGFSELITSEIFKSKKILEATLMDDLSAMHLTLRANNEFEMVSSTVFSEQVYKGNYIMLNNKIIFKDKRDDNNLIPDTLTIIGNKIILHFDKNGKPVTDFARYFDIDK